MTLSKIMERFGLFLETLERWRVSPAFLAAGAVFLITAVALFTPPYIGVADNGDFFRILYSNGLYFRPGYDSQYLGYFVRQYGILQYYNENGATLFSSQSLFVWLAVGLNKLLYSTVIFDIRFQAAVYLTMYVAAVYLLVEGLTWKVSAKRAYWIAAVAVFVFADTGYTAYFNSFFSESLVLIMMLFVFASGLLLYRKRYNPYLLLTLFGIASLLLTTSKQQNAPIGMILAVVSVFMLYIRKSRWFRVWTGFMLLCLVTAGLATYLLIPQEFVNINKYHALTRGVLLYSSDPEAALKSMGINEQYALLNGTVYYSPYSTVGVNSPGLEQELYGKYGFGSILLYYASHPSDALRMLKEAAQNAFTIRPGAMGNYEQSAGHPFGAHTSFFSSYSWLKQTLAPKTFGFVVLWTLLIASVYMPSFISAIRERKPVAAFRLPFVLGIIAIGVSAIIVSIVGAGDADLAKHEFLFTLSFDLVTLLAFADFMGRRIWQNEKHEEFPHTPSQRENTRGISV